MTKSGLNRPKRSNVERCTIVAVGSPIQLTLGCPSSSSEKSSGLIVGRFGKARARLYLEKYSRYIRLTASGVPGSNSSARWHTTRATPDLRASSICSKQFDSKKSSWKRNLIHSPFASSTDLHQLATRPKFFGFRYKRIRGSRRTKSSAIAMVLSVD